DAVLSCGGMIAAQAHAGDSVAVVTVFAAGPQPGQPLSAFAQALHDRWQSSAPHGEYSDPAAVRRAEDLHALAALGEGAQAVHYALPDCIYRRAAGTGEPLYASEEAILGPVHPADPALVDLNASTPPPAGANVYVPLAIGLHVDHLLVYLVAQGWDVPRGRVRFYEDYPYVAQQEKPAADLLAARGAWNAQIVALPEDALSAKVRAAAAYE